MIKTMWRIFKMNNKTFKLIEISFGYDNDRANFVRNYCNKFDMEALPDSLEIDGYIANPIFQDYFGKLPVRKMLKYFDGIKNYENIRTVSDAVDVSRMKKDHVRGFQAKDYDLYFFVSSTYAMWSWQGREPLFEQAKFLVNPIFLNYIGNVPNSNSFGAFGTYYGDDNDYRVLVDDLTDKLGFVPFWNCE